ncbi:MAG: BrnT family toxin [Smithella sp.]
MELKKLLNATGFEWDDGNIDKNWIKHGVSPSECEQMFFNQPLVVAEDSVHPEAEERLFALGRADDERLPFVVFMIRKDKIRIISARDMSSKERKVYKQYESD